MIKTIVNGIPEELDKQVNEFEKSHNVFATQTSFIEFKGSLIFKATLFYKE
jgi:hypothetical protein